MYIKNSVEFEENKHLELSFANFFRALFGFK